MKHIVKLSFFKDSATGDYGVSHHNTTDDNYGNSFNAGWDALMIFHDVFEHYQEHSKYFIGDYAQNVGGEMFAMGAMWYYLDEMGFYKRTAELSNYYTDSERMRQSTESFIQEAISSGYCNYGYTLESNVPYQKPTENGELEYQCEQLYKNSRSFPLVRKEDSSYDNSQEREDAIRYRKSVTLGKIQNLHRYGFKQAAKLVPNNWDNIAVLNNFWDFWAGFTKNNSAEELHNMFSGIEFTITKKKGIIRWKAVLISKDYVQIKDVTLTEKSSTYLDMEDYLIMEEEY